VDAASDRRQSGLRISKEFLMAHEQWTDVGSVEELKKKPLQEYPLARGGRKAHQLDSEPTG